MSAWLKNKIKVIRAAIVETKIITFKVRPAKKKYNELYREFRKNFLTAREQGHRVDFNWLWDKARVIYREQQKDPDAIVRKRVIVNFIKSNSLKLRRTQGTKNAPKEHHRDALMKWHTTKRAMMLNMGDFCQKRDRSDTTSLCN